MSLDEQLASTLRDPDATPEEQLAAVARHLGSLSPPYRTLVRRPFPKNACDVAHERHQATWLSGRQALRGVVRYGVNNFSTYRYRGMTPPPDEYRWVTVTESVHKGEPVLDDGDYVGPCFPVVIGGSPAGIATGDAQPGETVALRTKEAT